MFLGHLPRFRLAHLPTPLHELPNLSRHLGGPRIFMKRDDCTGLATGGNKTRKLEFLVGDALARGARTLITEGGMQSNHCRQTAAAAAAAGLRCVLVMQRGQRTEVTGNLLLDQLLGARVVLVDSPPERRPMMAEVAGSCEGPYVMPTGGSNAIGALGYIDALHELTGQANAMGLGVDALVFCSGSGGTHGGLVAGARLLGCRARIIGVSDGEPRRELTELVLRVATDATRALGAPAAFAEADVDVRDEYAREGYGVPNAAMVAAVRLVARLEGILLDPVYTGKAMAGLVDLIRRRELGPGQTVVFIHTGGVPALFAYRDTFAEPL
jgi:D-cysteine desulfhydrase family pyridoxal phosphate-dependent enzyme